MNRSRVPDILWDDDALARECLAGNEEAWEALIAKYKRLVYSIPFRYGLPAEEAADVFQAVWADLFRDLRKIENAAALRGWLVTATARRCLLHKKRWLQLSGRAIDPQAVDHALDPAALLHDAEKDLLVRAAIEQLPERCQELVRMLFFEFPPRSYEAVARELGLAEGSIGFIRSRCLEKLRALLIAGEK